jgi:hypothetical protein
MLAGTPQIPPNDAVRDFISHKGLADLTQKAVGLVREVFPQLRAIKLEVSRDPEESAEWLVLHVTSAAPCAELAPAYRQYIRKWVSETPAANRHLVRLSYTSV